MTRKDFPLVRCRTINATISGMLACDPTVTGTSARLPEFSRETQLRRRPIPQVHSRSVGPNLRGRGTRILLTSGLADIAEDKATVGLDQAVVAQAYQQVDPARARRKASSLEKHRRAGEAIWCTT
jgi:hypothetical protein